MSDGKAAEAVRSRVSHKLEDLKRRAAAIDRALAITTAGSEPFQVAAAATTQQISVIFERLRGSLAGREEQYASSSEVASVVPHLADIDPTGTLEAAGTVVAQVWLLPMLLLAPLLSHAATSRAI